MEHFDPSRDLAGPTLTVVHDDAGAFAGMALGRRSRTRLAVVVADTGGNGEEGAPTDVAGLVAALPPGFEPDLLIAGGNDAEPSRSVLAGGVSAEGWSWQLVPHGQGRADTLDRLTSESAGDFIVVPQRTDALALMPVALGHLWVQGADAVVVSTDVGDRSDDRSDDAGPDSGRNAAGRRLCEVLGLRPSSGPRSPGMVVLRRWVARFLLDELGRAIDPGEELAERARLMELRLVEVVAPFD